MEDEDYQLRHEQVAGTGVREGEGGRVHPPAPARDGGRRASRLKRDHDSAGVIALAGRLLADDSAVQRRPITGGAYYLLEAAGLAVQLVSPAHARQLAGRPETGRLDAMG